MPDNTPRDVHGRPVVYDDRFEGRMIEELEALQAHYDALRASQPLWTDSLGREVDLTDIDREYAIRILAHIARQTGARRELLEVLVDTATNGRAPNEDDLARARAYNDKNKAAGLPWRAPESGR